MTKKGRQFLGENRVTTFVASPGDTNISVTTGYCSCNLDLDPLTFVFDK